MTTASYPKSAAIPGGIRTDFPAILRRCLVALALCAWFTAATAADEAPKAFDIPSGTAPTTLKVFSSQAGGHILYANAAVEGVKTNAVKGQFTPREALDRMLAGTELSAVPDAKNGALSIVRKPPTEPKPLTTAEVTAAAAAQSQNTLEQDDEVIVLSPFYVSADEDDGYRATSTMGGTRIKTNIGDVGAALTIVTKQFLEDTGATGNQDLLLYTPSTEVGGLNGNYGGFGNDAVVNETSSLLAPDTNTRVRGLTIADNARGYFLTDIPWDTYNVERVELQRGPNAILFGLGSPGGLVNANINQAGYKNRGSVNTRFDGDGSFRAALDLNHVLLKDELALRLDVLDNRTKYQQKPAFKDDQRIFGALRYDPKFLRRGGAHTTLRVSYEYGRINSANPRTLPPVDLITPWFEKGTTTVNGKVFNNLNQRTFDFRYNTSYIASVPGSGAMVTTSPNYQPQLVTFTGGIKIYFPTPNTGMASGNFYIPHTRMTEDFGLRSNGTVDGTILGLSGTNREPIIGTTTQIARNLGLPFWGAYKNKSLTDTSIFDFYNNLIDGGGGNRDESRDFEAFNIVLNQTFWKNRAGLELAFDHQTYEEQVDSLFGNDGITVDMEELLPDYTPNPNVGRPIYTTRSLFPAHADQSKRDESRITGFAELRADDFLEKSWLTTLLGRHVFTAVASRNEHETAHQNWSSYHLSAEDAPKVLLAPEAFAPDRETYLRAYLGPDLRTRSTASGSNLSNLSARLDPRVGNLVFFDSHWNRPTNPATPGYVNPAAVWRNPFNNANSTQSENPENYVGWSSVPVTLLSAVDGDRWRLIRDASKSRDEVTSKIFVWQGFLWNGTIVPTYGYRKDTAKAYSVTGPRNSTEGYVDLTLPSYYQLPDTPDNSLSGTSNTYSLVMHTPRFLRNKLPAGLHFSVFYNEASNFQPSANRTDVLGKSIDAPTGETKDYGIVISALNDRLIFKVNKYENAAVGAAYNLANLFQIGNINTQAWVTAKRYQAGLTGNPLYADEEYNYGTMVNGVFTQTAADRALQQEHVNAVLNGGFSLELAQAWNVELTDARWQADATGYADSYPGQVILGAPPVGMTATQDTVSKGYEFELNFQPVSGWNIIFNAAKNEAIRTNIASTGATGEMIKTLNAAFNGPAGKIRTGNGLSNETVQDRWNLTFYNNYALQQMLAGSVTPELRKWRFNVTSTYRFETGRLKGFMVGGSYQWQDKVAIGYPSIYVTINNEVLESFDVANPYFGPKEDRVNLWIGYQRKLTKKIGWRAQLNVQNAFGKNELIPINAQPDGSAAIFRIRQGPTWSITNAFTF